MISRDNAHQALDKVEWGVLSMHTHVCTLGLMTLPDMGTGERERERGCTFEPPGADQICDPLLRQNHNIDEF